MMATGLLLVVGTGGLLHQIDQHRRLGDPGLVMHAENVLDESGRVVNTNTVALPEQVLNYRSTNAPITAVELGYLPSDTTYARRIYTAPDGFSLQVNVVMMGVDRSSIHKPQFCLTGQGWQILSEEEDRIHLAGASGVDLPVLKMTAEQEMTMKDGSRQKIKAIYVYWFVADGFVTARHDQRMWWMAKELLSSGTTQRWAYVSTLALCRPGQEQQAYERIKEFIEVSAPVYHIIDDQTVFAEGVQPSFNEGGTALSGTL